MVHNTFHPQSFVHPDAQIGSNVTISPFAYIDKNVVIGKDTWIGPHATIMEGARIGNDCKIFPGAVISAIPQDLKFKGEDTTVEIGDHTIIREYVTINRGTSEAHKTTIGSHCLLMAYVHVAHDCQIGNRVIMANGVNLAGHVIVEDWAILEGLVAVQQFVRIGAHSFIAGGSLVRKNVPPFVKAAREPLAYAGINVVGLRRRQYSEETINTLHEVYRLLFVKGQSTSNALLEIENAIPDCPERAQVLQFVRQSEDGIIKGLRSSKANAEPDEN